MRKSAVEEVWNYVVVVVSDFWAAREGAVSLASRARVPA